MVSVAQQHLPFNTVRKPKRLLLGLFDEFGFCICAHFAFNGIGVDVEEAVEAISTRVLCGMVVNTLLPMLTRKTGLIAQIKWKLYICKSCEGCMQEKFGNLAGRYCNCGFGIGKVRLIVKCHQWFIKNLGNNTFKPLNQKVRPA